MISLKINSTKNFMQKLLRSEIFDVFLLVEGTVITSCSYTIDGRLQKEFYTMEEWEDKSICPYEFAKWADMKELVFQMIKGTHTPVYMKFSLMLRPEIVKQYELAGEESLIKGYVLNIRYESGVITCVTGVSYNGFSMDKEPEKLWDKRLQEFFEKNEIEFE